MRHINSEFEKKTSIGETEKFKIFSDEFEVNIAFLEDFTNLIKYNRRLISFITEKKIHYVTTNLLDNSVQTLRSIKLCCSIGAFTDANTLIRKLRDDLILFVYILDVVNQRKPFIEEDLKELNLQSAKDFAASFSKIRFNSILTVTSPRKTRLLKSRKNQGNYVI